MRVADDDQKPPEGEESHDSVPDEVDAPEPEAGVVEESDELDLDDLDLTRSRPEPTEPSRTRAPSPSTDSSPSPSELPPASEPAPPTRTDGIPPERRRQLRLALIGALLVLGVLYIVGFIMTGLRMPANATIGGVDVSGMSPRRRPRGRRPGAEPARRRARSC